MIKTLVKKQLTEIFRSYVYNPKTGKSRSKAATAGFVVLFVFLLVAVIGGMFTLLSVSLAPTLSSVGMDWLYFALIGLIAILFGAFGSVFNTYSGLYLAKDNDLLLSCPIPTKDIIISRLLGVYIMGLIYSGSATIPAVAVYTIVIKATAASVICGIVFIFLISMIVLTLSCILGYVVAKISQKLKTKSFVAVLSAFLFIGLYYFVYFKAGNLMGELLANAALYGQKIRDTANAVYVFGMAAAGDAVSCIKLTAVTLVFFFAVAHIIFKSFLKIATASEKTSVKSYRQKEIKVKKPFTALYFKELKRFTSSAGYMLNCGFGILFILILGGTLLLKGGEFSLAAQTEMGIPSQLISAAVIFAMCLVSGMNNMAVPSVSLEGKSIWLLQSLPVLPEEILRAKLLLQISLTSIPLLFCSLCAVFSLSCGASEKVMMIIFPQVFTVLLALFGLFMGLKMPNLNWTTELTVIKQSGCVAITLLVGSALPIVMAAVYFLLQSSLGFFPVFLALTVILLCLCAVFASRLKKSGTRIFANL